MPLRGDLKGPWRLRGGSYRVVYAIDDSARAVTVAAVGLRGSVYG
jgi:mRNA-degrading endonuclease RelE of RelBE toxin-antitoxin system